MTRFLKKNKKILTKFTSILLLSLVLFAAVAPVHAAETPPPAEQPGTAQKLAAKAVGWAVAPLLQGMASPTMSIVNVILYIIRVILSFILSMVAGLLNYAFELNVSVNPADWNVVRVGWSISRDIVNSLFILVVLWIAFTIIFSAEKYGGKQLLAKVIVLALVINFSLVMVTAVFGFSNAFANIFAKQIPKDVSGFIVNALKTQSVTGGDGFVDSVKKSFGQAQADEETRLAFSGQRDTSWDVKNTLLASLGMTPAAAADGTTNEEQRSAQAAGNIGGIGAALKDSFITNPPSWFAGNVRDMIGLSASNVYLILTIVVILVGAVTLLLRILWMIVLSIVAPLALLARVLPIGQAQSYFKQWISYLLRWAFFAPGFYFLFYLSLLMIQTFDKAGGGQGSQVIAYIDLNRLVQLLLSLGFLVFAVKFAKQTGGALADATIGAASKVGMLAAGAATGGAALAAGGLARAAAPTIQKGIQGISSRPIVGKIMAPATTRVQSYVEEQQKVVEKKRAQFKGQSDDMVLLNIKTSVFAQDKIAGVLEMMSRQGGVGKLINAGVDLKEMSKIAAPYGNKVSTDILNASYGMAPAKNYQGSADQIVLSDILGKNATAFDKIAGVLEMLSRPGGAGKLTDAGIDLRDMAKIGEVFGQKTADAIRNASFDLSPVKDFGGKADDFVVQEVLKQNTSAFDRVAGVLEMLKRPGGVAKMSSAGVDMSEILNLAKKFGEKPIGTILQSRPDLANASLGAKFTLEEVAKKIKPDDVDKVDWSGMMKSMSGKGMNTNQINTELRRITEQLMFSGGSTERFGKMMSSMTNMPKEARNSLNTTVQNIVNDQSVWNNLEKTDEELLKRYLGQIVVNPSKVVSGIQPTDSMRDMATRMGVTRGRKKPTPLTGRGNNPTPPGPTNPAGTP